MNYTNLEKMKKKQIIDVPDILRWIGIILISLIILGTFFCPIIISILTGNWWFMLLFMVSWIPSIVESLIFIILTGITQD